MPIPSQALRLRLKTRGAVAITCLDEAKSNISDGRWSPAMESRPLKGVVADEIRNRIIVGALNFGERVSDKDLATELRVSRTPVREAILQLQSEGLIVVRPRSGTFVFDLSAEDLREICDLRGLFEAGAIRMGGHQHDRMI